jgi:hypothetical protein
LRQKNTKREKGFEFINTIKAKIKAARNNADDKFLKYFPEVSVEN